MKKYFKSAFFELLLWEFFSLVDVVAGVSFAIFIKKLVEMMVGGNYDNTLLLQMFLMGILCVCCYGFSTYCKDYFKTKYARKVWISIRDDFCKSILNSKYDGFIKYSTAEYLTMMTNDMSTINESYLIGIPSIFSDTITFIVAGCCLWWMNPYLALIAITINVLPIWIPFAFGKKIISIQKRLTSDIDLLNEKFKNIFAGYETIFAYNVEDMVYEDFHKRNIHVEGTRYKMGILRSSMHAITLGISFSIDVVVMITAAFLVAHKIASIGVLIASVQLLNYISTPIQRISKCYGDYKSSIPIIQRLNSVFEMKRRVLEEEKIKIDSVLPIEIKNLVYQYDCNDIAINNLTLVFQKGKKYALIGESGSGKSTLVKLLINTLSNYEGEINLGNRELSKIPKNELCKKITLMQQDVFLFDATIRDNISMYAKFDDSTLKEAMAMAGLNDLLLEKGLDYEIKENGRNLSGGEAQRIAIARALVRKSEMLLLDEITSNLDEGTAVQIEKTVLNLPATVVNVVHRLNGENLKKYDKIFVMKKGRIVASGKYYEVIDKIV